MVLFLINYAPNCINVFVFKTTKYHEQKLLVYVYVIFCIHENNFLEYYYLVSKLFEGSFSRTHRAYVTKPWTIVMSLQSCVIRLMGGTIYSNSGYRYENGVLAVLYVQFLYNEKWAEPQTSLRHKQWAMWTAVRLRIVIEAVAVNISSIVLYQKFSIVQQFLFAAQGEKVSFAHVFHVYACHHCFSIFVFFFYRQYFHNL